MARDDHGLDLLAKRERDDYKAKIKDKDRQIELLSERLEKLRGSRWSIPLKRRKASKTGRPFTRVVIPDTHGCQVNADALGAMLDDLEALAPREIVMLGDHLECGGFLAKHHTLGYVSQVEYSFEADVDATNDLLDKIQARCPNAEIHYIEGNHERRIESWCVDQSLRHGRDSAFLLRHFGTSAQLSLEKRSIAFYKQGEFYMGLKVPATIKLGSCYFTHGHTSAKHTSAAMLSKYWGNVVFGHVHRADEFSANTIKDGTVKAWCPGCLCEKQPLWRHTDPTAWTHGYGVQLVQDDGGFLHINVPIIDGKSYLMGLVNHTGK